MDIQQLVYELEKNEEIYSCANITFLKSGYWTASDRRGSPYEIDGSLKGLQKL